MEIGILASDFLLTTTDAALMNRPNLEEHVYRGGNKFPPKLTARDIKQAMQLHNNDLSKAVPLYDFPYSKEFENYCYDPFNEEHKAKFIDALTCGGFKGNGTDAALDGEGKPIKLEPPFLVTWPAMAVDLGLGEKEQRVSAEMVNKWVILPLIMHVLFARQNNQTLEETAANVMVQNLVKYLMRHHVHNFGLQALLGHQIMSHGYDLNWKENLAASASYAILPASIYIAETINAALTNVVITGSETLEQRRKRLQEETEMVVNIFYTMSNYSGYVGLPAILRSLGEKKFYNL